MILHVVFAGISICHFEFHLVSYTTDFRTFLKRLNLLTLCSDLLTFALGLEEVYSSCLAYEQETNAFLMGVADAFFMVMVNVTCLFKNINLLFPLTSKVICDGCWAFV